MSLPEPSDEQLEAWRSAQLETARAVVDQDDHLPWSLSRVTNCPSSESPPLVCCGADVSFSTANDVDAVATLTAVLLRPDGSMCTLYSASRAVTITVPYSPTYLAFREAPFIEAMLLAAPADLRERIAVLLMDGNGQLHPRGAGLACQVGVRTGIPTIGVGKTLMCMDGLVERTVREQLQSLNRGDATPLVGESGKLWGNALLTGNALTKPLFVSCGHRVSLDTATRLVRSLCVFRIPEPIRLADLHSREALRGKFVSIDLMDSLTHL
jgi:endonuclease V